MIKIKVFTLLGLLMPTLAHALPQPFHGYGQVLETGTGAFMGTVVGTCTDGSMMLDVNGLVRCGSDTTTDPTDVIVRSGACYELDATCTAPDLLLAGGIDTKQYTSVTQANCGTDTITVTVVDNGGTSTANALVEGTDWDCLTDDNTCATALAAAIDALDGVSSQASTNTVGVRPDDTTIKLTLATSDATCATASNGTKGVIGLPVAQRLVFDADADANNYWEALSDTTLQLTVEGSIIASMTTAGYTFGSNKYARFGGGGNYWWIYDTGTTALELNSTDCDGGGTDCVVLSVDDGDAILDLRNDEFLHNETDGKITLGGAGGTNNESLILDFESAANNITLTSGTGATVLSWAGSIYGSATSNLGLTGRSLVKAPAVGQIGLTNWASSSGATLDVDDAADTIVIKDQAGTGNGNLTVTGTTNTAAVEFNVTSIDSDDSAYTVLATDHVIVCDPDSGSVPADTTISLPASAGIGRTIIVKNIGTTYDCLVDPNGTEEIDNSGAGTAITVDTKGSLTVIDVGASTFEWIIE